MTTDSQLSGASTCSTHVNRLASFWGRLQAGNYIHWTYDLCKRFMPIKAKKDQTISSCGCGGNAMSENAGTDATLAQNKNVIKIKDISKRFALLFFFLGVFGSIGL